MAAPGAIHLRLQGAEGDILGNKHTVSVAPSAGRCKLPLAHRALSENVQFTAMGTTDNIPESSFATVNNEPKRDNDVQADPNCYTRVEDTLWRIPTHEHQN